MVCPCAFPSSSPRPSVFPPPAAVAQVLVKHKIVADDVADKVKAFIASNQTSTPQIAPAPVPAPAPAPAPAKAKR